MRSAMFLAGPRGLAGGAEAAAECPSGETGVGVGASEVLGKLYPLMAPPASTTSLVLRPGGCCSLLCPARRQPTECRPQEARRAQPGPCTPDPGSPEGAPGQCPQAGHGVPEPLLERGDLSRHSAMPALHWGMKQNRKDRDLPREAQRFFQDRGCLMCHGQTPPRPFRALWG